MHQKIPREENKPFYCGTIAVRCLLPLHMVYFASLIHMVACAPPVMRLFFEFTPSKLMFVFRKWMKLNIISFNYASNRFKNRLYNKTSCATHATCVAEYDQRFQPVNLYLYFVIIFLLLHLVINPLLNQICQMFLTSTICRLYLGLWMYTFTTTFSIMHLIMLVDVYFYNYFFN